MQKPKRINKSKEQLSKEMELKYEQTRQRKLVKDILYPWLVANSKSVDDAKNMVYAATLALQSTFHVAVGKEQTRLSTIKTKDLEVESNMKADKEYDRDRELMGLFHDEPVATSESLLKGLKLAIESFEREASTKLALKDLPAELLD